MSSVLDGQGFLLTGLHYSINYGFGLYGSGGLIGVADFNIQICPNVITAEAPTPSSFDDSETFNAPSYLSGAVNPDITGVDDFVSTLAAAIKDFLQSASSEITSVSNSSGPGYTIERAYQGGPTIASVTV